MINVDSEREALEKGSFAIQVFLSGVKNQLSPQIRFQTFSCWLKKTWHRWTLCTQKTPLMQSLSGGRTVGNQVLSPPLPNTHQVQNLSGPPLKIHLCCHQVYLANQVYNMHQVSAGCQLCPYDCLPMRPVHHFHLREPIKSNAVTLTKINIERRRHQNQAKTNFVFKFKFESDF